MRKKPNPKVFMIMMALTLLAGSALGYMQYNALSDASARVAQLRNEAKDEKEVEKERDAAQLELDETNEKIKHLEKGVTEVAYVPTLLKEIESTGQKAGLTVLGVRPIPRAVKAQVVNKKGGEEDAAPKKPYTEMDIEIRCRGNYRSVMNFTRALQMFPKIVAARTVSLQPKTGQDALIDGQPALEATIEMRSYLFPLGKNEKPEEEAAPVEKTINISGRNKGVE